MYSFFSLLDKPDRECGVFLVVAGYLLMVVCVFCLSLHVIENQSFLADFRNRWKEKSENNGVCVCLGFVMTMILVRRSICIACGGLRAGDGWKGRQSFRGRRKNRNDEVF